MSSFAYRVCGQVVFLRTVPGHVVPERLQVCYACDLPTAAATLESARSQFRESVPASAVDAAPVYFCEGVLYEPDAFEPKFVELRKRGYSWLNFNLQVSTKAGWLWRLRRRLRRRQAPVERPSTLVGLVARCFAPAAASKGQDMLKG